MLTGIFLFFSKAFGWITDILKSVFKVVIEHPKEFLMIVAGVVCAYFIHTWGISRGEARAEVTISALNERINYYEAQAEAREEKLALVEAEAKKAADENEQKVKTLAGELGALAAAYEVKIEEARSKEKIVVKTVYVKVPGIDKPTPVEFEDNQQVCNRYPAGYTTTVNSMVEAANKRMKAKK